jgi:adenosylcobinamide-phosphate synthase
MRLEYQVLVAMGLDAAMGDPRWMPHPVKLMGRLALVLEAPLRRTIKNARLAGVAAVLLVTGSTAALTGVVIFAARRIHPSAGDAVSILFLYWSFAARDLASHASTVYRALAQQDLPAARRLVALMVGRDTAALDEAAVARAAVESVAENTVDGVVAPLLFGLAGGPVGAMLYKAINTLDSTFGYRTERYREFGWASARLDDLANYLPARLTVPFLVLAALPWKGARRAFFVSRRDGRRHASPNSGLAEAAMAGALGVRLGGPLTRGGVLQETPFLGTPAPPPGARHICRANAVMLTAVFLAAAVLVAARFGITAIIR